ncbi:hypothetical protein AVEN_94572-1 [Araneus ventricosus]|uniref:Uncharacterized protein n=1 Tax=Araneus ventricosus TaxID=182803 RepID=A0A4Y2ITG7_ARAVE|nr:hypothetical protein AVEN_94572-1 [Araneus ventricosus]
MSPGTGTWGGILFKVGCWVYWHKSKVWLYCAKRMIDKQVHGDKIYGVKVKKADKILLLFPMPLVLVLSWTKSKSSLAHRKSRTIDERFMVKEESAASAGTRPWTPEGRSLTVSIAFML